MDPAHVRVLLTYADEAWIVPDVDSQPMRYPAGEISAALGVPSEDLPGLRLLADRGPDDTLTGWRLAHPGGDPGPTTR